MAGDAVHHAGHGAFSGRLRLGAPRLAAGGCTARNGREAGASVAGIARALSWGWARDYGLRAPSGQSRNASRFKASHIADNDDGAMHQGSGGDRRIAVGTAIRNMKSCTTPRDCAVDHCLCLELESPARLGSRRRRIRRSGRPAATVAANAQGRLKASDSDRRITVVGKTGKQRG